MGIFVDMTVKEVEIEGVKFKIRPLTGEEIDRLQDAIGEYRVTGTIEGFKTSFAEMRTMKILMALTGKGCGWDALNDQQKPIPVTEEAIKSLKSSVRDRLAEEIDNLSSVEEEQKKT